MLGPRHWNVAYVQPSRRPDDGRFGENPNRLFKHHQFQVILKPSPDEVQQIYLQSLEACGIDPRAHDIRFEEDNWESPTLGAWGIGWQVMLRRPRDHAVHLLPAGRRHRPVADLGARSPTASSGSRCSLQKVDNVYDLEWAPGVKYRDVRLRDEIEQSKYAFGQVDMPREAFAAFHRDLFDGTTRSRETLLASGLVLPALEHCLKCSHLFNVLDASGSVGVTERTAYILRVRQLAVAIAKAYVGDRGRARRHAGREPSRRAYEDRHHGSRTADRIGVEETARRSWLPR